MVAVSRIAAVTAACLAVAVVAVSCSDAAAPSAVGDAGEAEAAPAEGSTDAGAEDGDAAPSCGLPGVYGSKECMECVGAKCCALVAACESDATCKQLQKCSLDCLPRPDAGGCYETCQAAYPAGKPLWDPVDRCWFGPPPAGCLVECTN